MTDDDIINNKLEFACGVRLPEVVSAAADYICSSHSNVPVATENNVITYVSNENIWQQNNNYLP